MRIIGFVLLGILALILLLLIVPVTVTPSLKNKKWTVRLRVLFLTFRVYPARRKRKVSENDGEETDGESKIEEFISAVREFLKGGDEKKDVGHSEKPGRSPGRQFGSVLSSAADFMQNAGGLLKKLFRAIRIRRFCLILPIHGEDPYDTAMYYGRFCAWFSGILALLANFTDLRTDRVELLPDFNGENASKTKFSCNLSASPIIILVIGIRIFIELKHSGLLPEPGKKKTVPDASKRFEAASAASE